jgi:hypothetical protein
MAVLAAALAAPSMALAQPLPTPVQAPPPPTVSLAPGAAALQCQLIQPVPYARSVAQVTNLSMTTLPAGRVINVFAVQSGSSGAAYTLTAPLPPGGRVSIPLTGTATLARDCVANSG